MFKKKDQQLSQLSERTTVEDINFIFHVTRMTSQRVLPFSKVILASFPLQITLVSQPPTAAANPRKNSKLFVMGDTFIFWFAAVECFSFRIKFH
jgi:hypothetical protein